MEAVGGSYFPALEVNPFLGTFFDDQSAPEDGHASAVVVLSHQFWKSTLFSDPTVIGTELKVEGQSLTIVGVTPQWFSGITLDTPPDLFVPINLIHRLLGGVSTRAVHIVARIDNRSSPTDLQPQINAVWPTAWDSNEPRSAAPRPEIRIDPLAPGISDLRPRYRNALYVLGLLASLLAGLAIASAIGLASIHSVKRSSEIATRRAIGAGSAAIATQFFAEWMLLGVICIVLSSLLSGLGSEFLVNELWTISIPRSVSFGPTKATFAAIAIAIVAITCLMTVVSYQLSKWRLASNRKFRSFSAPLATYRISLVPQVGLAFVLTTASLLFFVQVRELRSIELGYQRQDLKWTRLEPVPAVLAAPDQSDYFRDLLLRIGLLPDVKGAALSISFPTVELRQLGSLPAVSSTESALEMGAFTERVSPGFMAVTGIPLRAGRDFTWLDNPRGLQVVIVNETLAQTLFPDGDALGRVVYLGRGASARATTVIGILANSSPGDPRAAGIPIVYRPIAQETPQLARSPVLLAKTSSGNPLPLQMIEETVNELGRHYAQPLRSVDSQLDKVIARERMLADVSLAFAIASILVAAIGLFSSVTLLIEERRREMAIRLAVGASTLRILTVTVARAIKILIIGLVIGMPIVVVSSSYVAQLVVGLPDRRLLAALVAASMVLLVGIGAAIAPVRRVLQMIISDALRE